MATVSHTPPTEPRAAAPGPLRLAGQFFLGVVLLLLVLLLGWLAFGYFGTDDFQSADAKRVLEREKILADRQAEDGHYLHDKPSWFKKDQGLVRVPIEEAMRLTLPTLQADKPHAAYPIATPPPDSGAPTSPDKGAGSVPGANTNPPASNPTTGHPVPTPAPSPTPALPANVQAPTVSTPAPAATPAPTPVPTATVAPTPAPTPTPMPTVTPAPTGPGTPVGDAPGNNSNNPGSAPIPGKEAQPMPTPLPEVTPAPATQPAPMATATPVQAAAPAAGSVATPTPAPNEPGASPAGTP